MPKYAITPGSLFTCTLKIILFILFIFLTVYLPKMAKYTNLSIQLNNRDELELFDNERSIFYCFWWNKNKHNINSIKMQFGILGFPESKQRKMAP